MLSFAVQTSEIKQVWAKGCNGGKSRWIRVVEHIFICQKSSNTDSSMVQHNNHNHRGDLHLQTPMIAYLSTQECWQ